MRNLLAIRRFSWRFFQIRWWGGGGWIKLPCTLTNIRENCGYNSLQTLPTLIKKKCFNLQFFVDRIEHLVQCKHMHMLRWARFCEHTKAIENLFPVYQKRLR